MLINETVGLLWVVDRDNLWSVEGFRGQGPPRGIQIGTHRLPMWNVNRVYMEERETGSRFRLECKKKKVMIH